MKELARWRFGLVAILSAASTVSVAWPCSRAYSGGFGPVWTGESWATFGAAPPELSSPGRPFGSSGSTIVFDDAGTLLAAEPFVAPALADGRFGPHSIAPDGTVWGTVYCREGGEAMEPLCGQALRVDGDGNVLEAVRSSVAMWQGPRSVDREQEVEVELKGGFTASGREPYRLVARWPGRSDSVELSPPFAEERVLNGPDWTLSAEGDLAVLWFADARVTLVRYDSGGREVLRREYPQSQRASVNAGPEAPLKLARGRMLLATDGSLVLGRWSINSDCSPRHGSSFIVLDSKGDLRAWVEGDEVFGMDLSPDGVVAVRRGWGQKLIELFDLDGELVGEIALPDPWQTEREALTSAAEQITRESDPADWIRYHSVIPSGQHTVNSWILETWPKAADVLPLRLALQLGDQLCARETERAPQLVLAAFLEEQNFSRRVEALATLSQCFVEAPPEIADFMSLVADQDDEETSHWVRRALLRWSSAVPDANRQRQAESALEGAWQELLHAAPGAGLSPQRGVDGRLLLASNLPQIEKRVLETVAAGGSDAVKVVDLLHDVLLVSPMGSWRADQRSVIARWVDAWAESEDAAVVEIRDLFSLASSGDGAAAERLFAAAREGDDLGFWLGVALAAARSPPQPPQPDWTRNPELTSWAKRYLRDVRFELPDGCRAGGSAIACRGVGSIDPFFVLAALAGEGAVDAVWDRVDSDDPSDRSAALRVAAARPELLTDVQWRRLLELPQLEERESLRQTLQMLGGHPGRSSPTWAEVERLFDGLVARHGLEPVVRAGDLWQPHRGAFGQINPLVSLLEPVDLASLGLGRELQRWLPLIAEVGAWPEIAGELETMLDGYSGVQAALALAPLGDRRALDILLDRGLTEWGDPVPGLRHFGAEAVDRLVPLAQHQDPRVRSKARQALRRLGMPDSVRAELFEEARRRAAEGEMPELESVLLAEDDLQITEAFVRGLARGDTSVFLATGMRPAEFTPEVVELVGRVAARENGTARDEAVELLERWSKHSPLAAEKLRKLRR